MVFIKKMVMHGFKSFAKRTEVVFDKGINIILGPNGSGKCITEDSLVHLGDGSMQRIGDIVNWRLESAAKTEDGFIAPGDGTEVMCLDFNTLKVCKKKIKAFVKRISPEYLLKIKTRSGKSLTTTKYHPLFILKDGKVVPAKAEELKNGMRIAIPRNITFVPETPYFLEMVDIISKEDRLYAPYREEFEFILKMLKEEYKCTWRELSERLNIPFYAIKGLLDGQSINIYTLITILKAAKLKNEEILELLQNISSNGKETTIPVKNSEEFARFLGYLLAEGRLSESGQVWFTNGDREIVDDYIALAKKLFNEDVIAREYKPRCWDVLIFSEPLIKILRKFGMASNTENKQITSLFLKHASDKEIAQLLNGLYCGDGYVNEHAIEITTKSEKLARGIETCLLRLGIVPRTHEVTKGIKESGFSGQYLSISIYGVENMIRFRKFIKLVHKRKNEIIEKSLLKKANPNCDLIEVNDLIRGAVKDAEIKVKPLHSVYPRLDSYCYSDTLPSRNGLTVLLENVLTQTNTHTEQLRRLVNSDIFWDEISEIEETKGEEWVYDLCVDEHHNFIANNIFAHNSNISDALCFVLGRLSIKTMRAAKAKNLLFMGSKYIKPAREASVEMVLDNSDRAFSIDKDEVSIKRAVRFNGQSVYKINDEIKTRIEIIEMLAQAGIDPHGFNLILQGQIQSVVKMHSEDRRKIIEEVAGISIYESRKEKSLHELEKTDEKLREISAILRERTAYLKNLDRERAQALRFKELELTIKKVKATMLSKKIEDKQKELKSIESSVESKNHQKENIKIAQEKIQKLIENFSEKINQVNRHIQQATGIEQETLHNQVGNLKAEIAGLEVRKENYEHRAAEIDRRINEMSKSIPEIESEIHELKTKSPLMAKKVQELSKKKEELAQIEEERKKVLTLKTELSSLNERIKDKERQLSRVNAESESLLKQLEEYSLNLEYTNEGECSKEIKKLKADIVLRREEINSLHKQELESEKIISVSCAEITRLEKIISDVRKIDVCPLCQSKITPEHVGCVAREAEEKIKQVNLKLNDAQNNLKKINTEREKSWKMVQTLGDGLSLREIELQKHKIIADRKDQLRKVVENEKIIKEEIKLFEERAKNLENKTTDFSKINEQYDSKILEIEEISSRTEEDVDTTLLYKGRELEKIKSIVERSKQDIKELNLHIKDISENLDRKTEELAQREEQERKLNEKFKKMFEERDLMQKEMQEKSAELSEIQNSLRQIEDQVNYLRIGKAKFDAEKESLEIEMNDYSGIELIQASLKVLEERLLKSQEAIQQIGSINMRALEVYDQMKNEYDKIQEKVNILENEKQEILKIIEEIDLKKKRSFMRTFRAMNELFTRNFSQLYSKGVAFLELENKEDIFAGGVNIIVKLIKGKYFDVTSLSGGEQTLVALSLLFAIQEYKPYHFYVFDEIDAALDKRNSERLAGLLSQYMKAGQYIVITHNDAIIMNANVLYGVSMHDGVSKILSLKVSETKAYKTDKEEQLPEKNAQVNSEPIQDSAPLAAETLEESDVINEENSQMNEE